MTSDLSKTGILLLSHGSRLDQGKKVIEAYTQMYKEEFPEAIVEYGFMEMREPNIPQSINKLTNGNDLEKIIVVPVFVAEFVPVVVPVFVFVLVFVLIGVIVLD